MMTIRRGLIMIRRRKVTKINAPLYTKENHQKRGHCRPSPTHRRSRSKGKKCEFRSTRTFFTFPKYLDRKKYKNARCKITKMTVAWFIYSFKFPLLQLSFPSESKSLNEAFAYILDFITLRCSFYKRTITLYALNPF